jgi:hypothetical protein
MGPAPLVGSATEEAPSATEGLTRRRLLGRAAGGAAALVLAGYGLNALRFSPTPAIAPYATGYNDDFSNYAREGGGLASLPFEQVKSGGGQYVRQLIDWRVVQPNPYSRLDFSHYDPLRSYAQANGLKVLPHFINCCPEFRAPSSSGRIRYPAPERYGNFGGFVAAGMDYFDEVADTAEIWNEPNLAKFGAVPPDVFGALIRASIDALSYYESIDAFRAGPKRVVSGGISVSGDSPFGPWPDYQREFAAHVGDRAFDFGLHSYDFRAFSGWAADAAADETARQALANVDEAATLLRKGQRVWLTETGVSAGAPLGRPGQARALAAIADGLWSRPACAAMIVHRLYPNPDDPDEQPPTSSFYKTAVFDVPYGTPQQAYFSLADSWGGSSG